MIYSYIHISLFTTPVAKTDIVLHLNGQYKFNSGLVTEQKLKIILKKCFTLKQDFLLCHFLFKLLFPYWIPLYLTHKVILPTCI